MALETPLPRFWPSDTLRLCRLTTKLSGPGRRPVTILPERAAAGRVRCSARLGVPSADVGQVQAVLLQDGLIVSEAFTQGIVQFLGGLRERRVLGVPRFSGDDAGQVDEA